MLPIEDSRLTRDGTFAGVRGRSDPERAFAAVTSDAALDTRPTHHP